MARHLLTSVLDRYAINWLGKDLRQRGRLESDLALTQPVAVTLATLEVEDLESDLAS